MKIIFNYIYNIFRVKFFPYICLLIGGMASIFIWIGFNIKRHEVSIPMYLLFITIYIVITLGISLFPKNNNHAYLFTLFFFVIYLGFISPRMTYFAENDIMNKYYSFDFMLLYPGIVFSLCLAYRLGGGSAIHCFKIGLSGLILLFSGLIDVMWFVVNRQTYIQDEVSIPHIEVLLGTTPTFTGLILFAMVHLFLLTILILFPIRKIFEPQLS